MKKKSIVCGVIASSIVIAATFGGCSLVSTNTAADMNRKIATVDISKAAKFNAEFGDYASAVGETNIIKRELVAYFINYGYSVYQQYYATNPDKAYEMTFNSLLDQLVDNAVLVQYSTLYLLREKGTNDKADGYDANALETYKSKESDKDKYEYLLGGEDSEDVYIAKYNLYYSINSAIDNQEKEILDEETSSNGTGTRTAPTGVDTQKENYYPQKSATDKSLDYGIYTGYAGYEIGDSGAYEKDKLEDTNNATRIAAYHKFISNLEDSSYNLVDSKKEDLRKVTELNYIQYEYVNQLKQRIINKYYDVYEEKQEDALKDLDKAEDKHYSTLDASYKDLLASQKENYKTESNFTSAMDSMSDTSFVLYAPDTEDTDNGGRFGYVYNILLPFSEKQSDALKALQSKYADSDLDGGYEPAYYTERQKLLEEIKTTDQREAWFNGETEYAFKADAVEKYYNKTDKPAWLFFENNVSQPDKYEPLDKYAGLYPYNGTVVEREDDYVLIPNELKINDMLDEFVAYIDYVMGDTSTAKTEWNTESKYSALSAENLYKADKVNGKDVIDYSNFVYAKGKVNFGSYENEKLAEADNRANLLYKDSAQYKALSAVNELQYAYTTDTGVLSQYLGYSVQAGDTNYIKEFEHAAHEAVIGGAGSFAVCAGDYGWHLIYVTYTFGVAEAQYGETPNWKENVDKEGTFENLYYEYYKSQNLPNISTNTRNRIITDFKGELTVKKYESAYKNLFELDKKN